MPGTGAHIELKLLLDLDRLRSVALAGHCPVAGLLDRLRLALALVCEIVLRRVPAASGTRRRAGAATQLIVQK